MKTKRLFIVLITVIVVLGASAYWAKTKLGQYKTGLKEQVVVVDAPPKDAASETPTDAMVDSKKATPRGGPNTLANCIEQSQYKITRSELGRIVNNEDMREHHIEQFVKVINEFRHAKGLPLPLIFNGEKTLKDVPVYNNCRSACNGMVHQVFVTQLKNNSIEVLLQDGSHKFLKLHDSGLEVAIVDELNAKGVPFRSWNVPASDGDWYIRGNNIFYPLDIEGMWLKIDTKSNWDVVPKPEGMQKLVTVEPEFKVAGCSQDEQCLQIADTKPTRHFKAPKACGPILKHASDEPSEHEAQ